jgi:DNA repair protein RadC
MTLPERGATLAQGFSPSVPTSTPNQRAARPEIWAFAAPGSDPGPESPRERLLARGAEALTAAELLSLCLRTGAPGVGAQQLSSNLLAGLGGLAALASTPASRLLSVPGLGPAKAATVLAALELGRRARRPALLEERPICSTALAMAFVQGEIGDAPRERFACLFLDSRHRPLGFEVLFEGSIDRAHVYPRELVKRVLTYNAAAVILAHNHPSGVCEPSTADIRLTHELSTLLKLLDIRLLDHLVVSGGSGTSFAARGLLADR